MPQLRWINEAAWFEKLVGAFKYFLAAVMMIEGIGTMFAPLAPLDGALGFLYGSRVALVVFGLIFFGSGLALLYGKLRKSKRWTGRGLMAIYLCFLFGAILQGWVYGFWYFDAWVPNTIAALITGTLWLRWKFKTTYVNPRHFVDEYDKLR